MGYVDFVLGALAATFVVGWLWVIDMRWWEGFIRDCNAWRDERIDSLHREAIALRSKLESRCPICIAKAEADRRLRAGEE